MNNKDILDNLARVIASRKGADPAKSYVAKLFAKGTKKIAQKVGEEGVETALAAVLNDRDEVISESADLMFHLMVLWSQFDITPDEVLRELSRREGMSGIDEKKSRKDGS